MEIKIIGFQIDIITMEFIIFYIGGAVVDNLIGAVLRERQKKAEAVAVVVAPSFTESARRAARAAPIPVILTNVDNVADAVLNYIREKQQAERWHQVYTNVFWVWVGIWAGVGMTITAQNFVKYL